MQNRLCRLHGMHDLRVETAPVPIPGAGEVLVAVGAGGICGSDLHYYHHGGFGPIRVREPIILGHEAAGTVRAVGPGVTDLASGMRVALNPSQPCGTCRYCRDGLSQHCLQMRFNGSAMRFPHEQGLFRDLVVLPAARCLPVGDHVTLGEAACAEPLAVCMHAVARARDIAGDMSGRRVLVTGAGPIGVLCAALAATAGAGEVVVTDLHDLPLSVARAMGASATHDIAADPQALAAYEADKGHFDIAFECSAAAPALRGAIAAVRPQGAIVQVGVAGDLPVPINLLVGKEIALIGTHRFHGEYAQAVAMIDDRRIDLRPMITAALPLTALREAFDMAGDRSRAVKVQITFDG